MEEVRSSTFTPVIRSSDGAARLFRRSRGKPSVRFGIAAPDAESWVSLLPKTQGTCQLRQVRSAARLLRQVSLTTPAKATNSPWAGRLAGHQAGAWVLIPS